MYARARVCVHVLLQGTLMSFTRSPHRKISTKSENRTFACHCVVVATHYPLLASAYGPWPLLEKQSTSHDTLLCNLLSCRYISKHKPVLLRGALDKVTVAPMMCDAYRVHTPSCSRRAYHTIALHTTQLDHAHHLYARA